MGLWRGEVLSGGCALSPANEPYIWRKMSIGVRGMGGNTAHNTSVVAGE